MRDIHHRLLRLERRCAETAEAAAANCTTCWGQTKLSVIYKGDPMPMCPDCGKVGRLMVIEPFLGPDGKPEPAEAEDLV